MRVNTWMQETLTKLEATKDINEKIMTLLGLWEAKQFGFFHGTKLGLDRKFDLGLTRAPLIDETDDFEGDFNFSDFQILIQAIQTNPHDADHLMAKAAERSSAGVWNHFYRKILLRRITWITAEHFNTVLSRIAKTDTRANQFTVELWQPQQYKQGSLKGIDGSFFLEPYLEGQRILTYVYADGQIKCLQEDGTKSEFQLSADTDWPLNFVLDGQLVDGILWVFDFILMEHFDMGITDMPLVERVDVLNQMIGLFQDKLPNVRILPKVEFNEVNPQKIQEVIQQYVEEGYTRAAIKPLQSQYDRTKTDWKLIKLS